MNTYKENYKILFVDDKKGLCNEFKEYVTHNTNHKVELAYNGQEALDKLEKEYYDSLILDLMMPVMKGDEAFAIIKDKYPKLSIIILTAYGDIKRASQMVREGAYDFISKGVVDIGYVLCQVLMGIKEKEKKEALKLAEEKRFHDLKIFSKGAAHEFKNSAFRSSMELTLLDNFVENIDYPKEISEKLLEHIGSLKKEAVRAQYIALRMKAMDENTKLDKTSINVRGFMYNLIQYFSKQISKNKMIIVENNLTLDIDSKVPNNINADKHYLNEAFIDLLDNTYDAAIPEREDDIKCDIIIKRSFKPDKNYVLFSFQDNGCGISKENLEYIFTPFYTTKGSDGIGLGMPYVKCVVEKHGGELEIVSELGKGTRVDVYIPVGDDP